MFASLYCSCTNGIATVTSEESEYDKIVFPNKLLYKFILLIDPTQTMSKFMRYLIEVTILLILLV